MEMQYSPVVILPKDDRMEINIAVRGTPPILSKARMPADALNNGERFIFVRKAQMLTIEERLTREDFYHQYSL